MDRLSKASKSHDILISLEGKEVAEFELIPKIGMMINLSLHIRGLPPLEYDAMRLAASHYFGIHPSAFRGIIDSLAEIEFIRLISEGSTIKKVIPDVPFFENIYKAVGDFADSNFSFNEHEQLALEILNKLSSAPTEISNIYNTGAEKRVIERGLHIGITGGYIITKRARGRDILITPTFFSENADVFADITAKSGGRKIQRILELIRKSQGWPLSIIEKTMAINGEGISADDLAILKSLAQDGAIKPPSITTDHSGMNYFLFPPAPGKSKLSSSNREIYERAMALVSSVRQGQLLAKEYAIKWPTAILRALKRDGWLRPTSETYDQYRQLAIMKVGRLVPCANGRHRLEVIRSDENIKAIDLAIQLIEQGEIQNMEVNQDARMALQKGQTYIESLIASSALRKRETIKLSQEAQEEIENIFIKGTSL